jgi:hypothetical protein
VNGTWHCDYTRKYARVRIYSAIKLPGLAIRPIREKAVKNSAKGVQ